ncbi:MAG: flagellar basal body rod protein FlgB [Dethiobacteraceae bacterium]|jgi:flagellar basal-body rod protein FlgB|nr:flagellar basal body rod protein FlgB [Bacillota bacterium]
MKLINDKTGAVLQLALDAAAARQRVSAHNVANINTPHFKRQEVLFEEQLKAALAAPSPQSLRRTHPRHLPFTSEPADLKHRVITDNSTAMRTDGNNVDIDREMVQLSTNQLRYNALTQVLNGRYSLLRYILQEGRR